MNGVTAASLGLPTGRARRRARGKPRRTARVARERYRGRSCSSSPSFPAATAGSSRRATTSTSASAAGSRRARGCATTSPALRGARHRPGRARRTCAATACRSPARPRARAGRTRSSATRPASSTRSRATGCSRPSSALGSRRSRARASWPATSGLAPYAPGSRAAGADASRVLGGEARPRPLSAARSPRSRGAPLLWDVRRAHDARRGGRAARRDRCRRAPLQALKWDRPRSRRLTVSSRRASRFRATPESSASAASCSRARVSTTSARLSATSVSSARTRL